MNENAVLLLVAGYLFGSIPIGLIAGKLVKGIDVREYGSGNIGASNVWRTVGPAWGVIVFILDVAKGLLPVLASKIPSFAFPSWMAILTGLAAIVGHNCSPFLKFKGGKGVATSLGVAFGMSPLAGVIGFGLWFVVLLLTRYISVGSIIAIPVCCVFIWWFNGRTIPFALFGVVASAFAIVKHRSNMARLRAGTEPKVRFRKPGGEPADTHT
jgi:glycerol-3-phosphate acyltransferase PlsY